ncbi:hypothetical protein SAMN05216419_10031, partial [Nitrosomonas cryotolerans]
TLNDRAFWLKNRVPPSIAQSRDVNRRHYDHSKTFAQLPRQRDNRLK